MSSTEIFVIIFGLVIGYWVVSKLIAPRAVKKQAENGEYHEARNENRADSAQERPWYDVLMISPTSTIAEIQAAYKSLIRQYHPDKVASLGEDLRVLAESKSKEINSAYQTALRSRGV